MIIESIYSGGSRKLYSVLLDPEEMRFFSKIQDEDYIEENKSAQKRAKYGNPLTGAAAGAFIGSGLTGSGKGALVGSVVGGGIGYHLGKKAIKKHKKELERYLNASEEDKQYLRDKEARLRHLAAIESAGATAGIYGGVLSRV